MNVEKCIDKWISGGYNKITGVTQHLKFFKKRGNICREIFYLRKKKS